MSLVQQVVGAGLVAVVLMAAGCGEAKVEKKPDAGLAVETYENPKVTLENFESIAVGDKYADLAAKLGEPAQTMYSVPDANVLQLEGKPVDSIVYWKHGSGDSMKEIVVWVKEGLVLEKGQRNVKAPAAEQAN